MRGPGTPGPAPGAGKDPGMPPLLGSLEEENGTQPPVADEARSLGEKPWTQRKKEKEGTPYLFLVVLENNGVSGLNDTKKWVRVPLGGLFFLFFLFLRYGG